MNATVKYRNTEGGIVTDSIFITENTINNRVLYLYVPYEYRYFAIDDIKITDNNTIYECSGSNPREYADTFIFTIKKGK